MMAALRQPGLSLLVLTLLAVVVGSGPVCAAICWSNAAGATGTERATTAPTGCHGLASSGEAVGSGSAPDCSHGAPFGPDATATLTAQNAGSRASVLTAISAAGAVEGSGQPVAHVPTTSLSNAPLLVSPPRPPLVLRI
jgi:hypothetical protein